MTHPTALTQRPHGTLDWIRTHKTELALVGIAAGAATGSYLAYRHMTQSSQAMMRRGDAVKHTLKIGSLITYTIEGKPVKPCGEPLRLVQVG